MNKTSHYLLLLLLAATLCSGCAATKPPLKKSLLTSRSLDQRNERLFVVKRFEQIKGGSFFFSDFEKKGNVCPLCQF